MFENLIFFMIYMAVSQNFVYGKTGFLMGIFIHEWKFCRVTVKHGVKWQNK